MRVYRAIINNPTLLKLTKYKEPNSLSVIGVRMRVKCQKHSGIVYY